MQRLAFITVRVWWVASTRKKTTGVVGHQRNQRVKPTGAVGRPRSPFWLFGTSWWLHSSFVQVVPRTVGHPERGSAANQGWIRGSPTLALALPRLRQVPGPQRIGRRDPGVRELRLPSRYRCTGCALGVGVHGGATAELCACPSTSPPRTGIEHMPLVPGVSDP